MLSRLLPLCAALAVAPPALADEVVATEKPVKMPANTGKPDAFAVPPGFQVERVFFVPKDKYGSWVSITTDDKGRLIASDQEGKGLSASRRRQGRRRDEPTKVEKLPARSLPPRACCSRSTACTSSSTAGPAAGCTASRVRSATTSSTRSRS